MPKRRDVLPASAALVAVLVVLAVGFYRLGPRDQQRAMRADQRRVEGLQSIARAVYYRKEPLPNTLSELPHGDSTVVSDPLTKIPYEYRRISPTTYELCATFGAASEADDSFRAHASFWDHPKGRHCYLLDTSQVPSY